VSQGRWNPPGGAAVLSSEDEGCPVLTQLNPPLPLETSKGPGWAHFVIDYGQESALLWVVFMDEDGACWTVPNHEVRMVFNWTVGRRKPQDVADSLAADAKSDPRNKSDPCNKTDPCNVPLRLHPAGVKGS
jgi:hypothetical protein